MASVITPLIHRSRFDQKSACRAPPSPPYHAYPEEDLTIPTRRLLDTARESSAFAAPQYSIHCWKASRQKARLSNESSTMTWSPPTTSAYQAPCGIDCRNPRLRKNLPFADCYYQRKQNVAVATIKGTLNATESTPSSIGISGNITVSCYVTAAP